jgi:hypothetical protein
VDVALNKADLILDAKRHADNDRLCSVQACATLIRCVVLPTFAHILRGHDPRAIKDACCRMDDAAYTRFLSLCRIKRPPDARAQA